MIGLFCKRALQKRRYSARETYNFKEPTNRSHPTSLFHCVQFCCWVNRCFRFSLFFLCVCEYNICVEQPPIFPFPICRCSHLLPPPSKYNVSMCLLLWAHSICPSRLFFPIFLFFWYLWVCVLSEWLSLSAFPHRPLIPSFHFYFVLSFERVSFALSTSIVSFFRHFLVYMCGVVFSFEPSHMFCFELARRGCVWFWPPLTHIPLTKILSIY